MSHISVPRRSLLVSLGLLPLGLALPPLLRGDHGGVGDNQQPHMHSALEALRSARRQLDLAAPDKGGHRAKAIEHVNAAIRETEAGIAYDATH